MYEILLPQRVNDPTKVGIKTKSNLVIIGANGSGKSRLAVWLESNVTYQVHRISAQRSLSIPEYAELRDYEQASTDLLWGQGYSVYQYKTSGAKEFKNSTRWGSNPAIKQLNDYDIVVSVLFAAKVERDRYYTEQAKINQTFSPPPDTAIDKLLKIWADIMPHRELSFVGSRILVNKKGYPHYSGSEMSDGERGVLYLIAQCLVVPENTVIIIDEPEIHIHKSIVAKLWNLIEEYCSNKLFIYITHDLEFAATRGEAAKIWIKSYNGESQWDWELLPRDKELPESLILEIIGNRKQVIFCEGEKGGLDETIYQLVYSNYHVIPRSGGDKVIEATKAFNNNTALHHLRAYGIVDSDYKEQAEKEALLKANVYALPVAEIENVLFSEAVLRVIAEQLGFNPDEKVREVVDFLMKALQSEFDLQVSSKAAKRVEYMLGAFSKKSDTLQGIKDGLSETISRIKVEDIYRETSQIYNEAVVNRNMQDLLLLFNRKSLLTTVSTVFGLKGGQYKELIIRLLKTPQKQRLIDAFKSVLPNL